MQNTIFSHCQGKNTQNFFDLLPFFGKVKRQKKKEKFLKTTQFFILKFDLSTFFIFWKKVERNIFEFLFFHDKIKEKKKNIIHFICVWANKIFDFHISQIFFESLIFKKHSHFVKPWIQEEKIESRFLNIFFVFILQRVFKKDFWNWSSLLKFEFTFFFRNFFFSKSSKKEKFFLKTSA